MTAAASPTPCLNPATGAIALGWGVRGLPGLAAFLGCPVGAGRSATQPDGQVVLAWGRRPSARRAERFAVRHRLPLWRLEDGFLRSVGLGNFDSTLDCVLRAAGLGNSSPPLSILVDDLGIHYDAAGPSRLEMMIAGPLSPAEIARAQALARAWRAGRVSKYNDARDPVGALPSRYVLAADQTWGDPAIRYGFASEASFARMLDAALAENPGCEVVLKVHPQVLAGRRRGHFDLGAVRQRKRVFLLGENVHPASLIAGAEVVYAVTSLIGFEGLLWDKPVRVFGMPFYAGWGLTKDDLPAPDRRHSVPLESLVHAALIGYARYLDPETGVRCEAERVLDWMSLQRRMRERFPAKVHATGFSRWKKPIVRDYFSGSRVEFVDRGEQVPAGATLAVWGRKEVAGPLPEGVRLVRLEDGFLRSVGLGADLVRPLSWVMDSRGMYYDAGGPSDLEHLLQTTEFSPEVRQRAAHLRERIVAGGLTKYNVGVRGWSRPSGAARVILVPGQVESDASIRLGSPQIRTNLGLLRLVREKNPEAFVVYKPHPDVVAGLRLKGQDEDESRHWCDEVLVEAHMDGLLAQVDEVHVLTSLAGFEALLRGKPVACYGQPFYAGWGLTTDLQAVARRTRRLTLDELVAGALISYPAYLSRVTGRFTTPERTLEELIEWQTHGPEVPPVWRQMLRWILRLQAS